MTSSTSEISAHGIIATVLRKRIRNIYLRVEQPHGKVRISAPRCIDDGELRSFLIDRIDWIKRQQARIAANPRPSRPQITTGAIHYFLGQSLQLELVEQPGRSHIQLAADARLQLNTPSDSSPAQRELLLERWYRTQLKLLIPPLLEKWQPVLNVHVTTWHIKRMKTKWGSCNIRDQRIWLNLELAKRPAPCLEYVVVHEMVHLLERYHNARFYGLMDQFLPHWRDALRQLHMQSLASL